MYIHTCTFLQMIHVTMDKKLRRRMEMDLKVCMESKDCPHTITFYGALFGEVQHFYYEQFLPI